MKRIQKIIVCCVAIMMCFVVTPVKVHATDTTQVQIVPSYHQTEARELTELMNEFRASDDTKCWNATNTVEEQPTNLQPFKYQYVQLEMMAKKRVAEIALRYSHTRPDGTNFDSIKLENPDLDVQVLAESYAADLDTPTDVINTWKSGDDYTSQEFRRAMLGDYQYIASACATIDGVKFWVTLYANIENAPVGEVPADNSEEYAVIDLDNTIVTSATMTNSAIAIRQPWTVHTQLLLSDLSTSEAWGTTKKVSVVAYVRNHWVSNDSSIITVTDSGEGFDNITAVGDGKTTLTTNAFGKTYTLDAYVGYIDLYRLYNPNSGEHFYTSHVEEKDMLVEVGWKYEDIGWSAPLMGDPVYRMYNPNAGDHHYTKNAAEKDMLVGAGWKYEGIGWYSEVFGTEKIYREYNPNATTGTHNYTRNYDEHNYLVSIGWVDEGIGWYGI